MFLHITLLWMFICGAYGQYEICSFYGLHADCWYRIDGISLSQIQVSIEQCSDPIQVTFTITNGRPAVKETFVFTSDDTLVSLPFSVQTQMRVRITHKSDNVVNIEADFFVYGLGKADFLNDDVKLWGISEQCPGLNTAGKIAVGVMTTLAAVAVILIIVVLCIRRERLRKMAQYTENQLINNAAETGTTTPVISMMNINEDDHMTRGNQSACENVGNGHMTGGNHVTYVNNENIQMTAESESSRVNNGNSEITGEYQGSCVNNGNKQLTEGKHETFVYNRKGHIPGRNHVSSVNDTNTNLDNVHDNNADTMSSNSANTSRLPQESLTNRHDGDSRQCTHYLDVRFSEIVKQENLKISPC